MALDHARELAIGTSLLDYYIVESKLGEGGMGVVYLVRNTKTGVAYAVKRSKFTNTKTQDLFLAELQTWIDLPPHPHIVTCRFFRTHDEDITIFSDFCDGGSLSTWIAGGKLHSLNQILDIAIQFAWGLHAAHLCGLVHQDVKPANVLMTVEGVAKVSDFGLSRATQEIGSDGPLAASAGMTPAYASPEQARGARLTRHTDVWSWGVSLLEMFLGEVLWHSGAAAGESLDSLIDESNENPDLAKRLKPELIAVLRRCFESDPYDRWGSLKEVADALIEIYEQESGGTYPRATPVVGARGEQRPRDDIWDVEQLVKDVLVAVGREADVSALDAAASSKGIAVGKIRLMGIALEWLEQPDDDDVLAWLLLRTRCLRAKASFHFDANDIHGCDLCLNEAISGLNANRNACADVDAQWVLADTHLDRSRYFCDAHIAERALEPARIATHIIREHIRRADSYDVKWKNFLACAVNAEANAVSNTENAHTALSLYDEAIRIREALPSGAANSNSLAISLLNKGNLLCRLGNQSDGIAVLERSLEIRERLCAEHPEDNFREDLGYSLYNLARVVLDAGLTERAALLADRLVQIRSGIVDRRPSEDANARLANALSLRAHILDRIGDAKGALENAVDSVCETLSLIVKSGRNELALQLRANVSVLALIFRKFGFGQRDNDPAAVEIVGELFADPAFTTFAGNPDFAGWLNDYAMALVRLKKFREAETHLLKCLEIDRRQCGDDSRETAMTLHNIGVCHFQSNSLAQAEHYFTEAAAAFRNCKAKRKYYAGSICMLAEVFSKSGREDQALEMFRRAVTVVETEQDSERELIAGLTGMARLLEKRGNASDAVEVLKAAYAAACRADGRGGLEPGRIADLLCLLLARCGQAMEAVPWFDEALECGEAHFGSESEMVRKIKSDFCRLLLDAGAQAQTQGDTTNAEQFFHRATSMAQSLADEAVEATAMTNLGLLQRQNGKREQAVDTLARALALNQRTLGPEHPNTLMCLSLYGVALVYAGHPNEALKCFEKGLVLAEGTCGKESQEARAFRQNYQQCLADIRKSRSLSNYP